MSARNACISNPSKMTAIRKLFSKSEVLFDIRKVLANYANELHVAGAQHHGKLWLVAIRNKWLFPARWLGDDILDTHRALKG